MGTPIKTPNVDEAKICKVLAAVTTATVAEKVSLMRKFLNDDEIKFVIERLQAIDKPPVKHKYDVTIKGNDIFQTTIAVNALNMDGAFLEANKLVKSYERCTIEALSVISIEFVE